MDKKQLAEPHRPLLPPLREKETVLLADRLRSLGYRTRPRPASRSASTTWSSRGEEGAARAGAGRGRRDRDQYTEGLITDGERYNKVIDIWAQVTEEVARR
jgi:DNA-directed RNA polymerase subunit beta'